MDIPFKVKSEFDTSQNQSGLKKKKERKKLFHPSIYVWFKPGHVLQVFPSFLVSVDFTLTLGLSGVNGASGCLCVSVFVSRCVNL